MWLDYVQDVVPTLNCVMPKDGATTRRNSEGMTLRIWRRWQVAVGGGISRRITRNGLCQNYLLRQ